MNITIAGAGRVGVHLAKYFVDEHQDVFLIDKNGEHLSLLENEFNLRTVIGEPIDFQALRNAAADKADVFVAVTAETSVNLVSCAMAKSMGAKKTIARVDRHDFLDVENTSLLRRMGVDNVVYPDALAALSVISSLEHSWCYGWNDFNDGAIVLAAVSIGEGAPIAGKRLKDLYGEGRKMHVSALRRNSRTLIPHGDDSIEVEDIVYITTVPDGIETVKEITGIIDEPVRSVILMGGSATAQLTAKMGSKNFSFVIIEKNIEKCRKISETCPDAEVIVGDGSEQEVLEEAGINHCDAFVALSDSSEGNILGCLTAKDMGVLRTVAEVEKEQFISKADSFKIGSIINKPIITANSIFQIILDSDQMSSKCFAMTDAEVAKLEIKKESVLTKFPVKDLKLPKELNIAGLIRDGKGEIVTGNTVFQEGDGVIVFCMNGSLNKVEKLFMK